MEIKVQKINIGKTQKGADKTGLFDGKEWFNVMGAHPEYDGKTLKLTKESFGQNWFAVDFVVDQQPASGNGNGNHSGIEWSKYEEMMRLAHRAAFDLEPDNDGSSWAPIADRSTARAALVNTVMIAFSNGKLILDDDIPF